MNSPLLFTGYYESFAILPYLISLSMISLKELTIGYFTPHIFLFTVQRQFILENMRGKDIARFCFSDIN